MTNEERERKDRELAEKIAGDEAEMERKDEEMIKGKMERSKDAEEAQMSKGINGGIKPGKKEVEEHERTHLPFRNWCKHCVFGKAKSNPHRRTTEIEQDKPVISIDYMYLHEKKEKGQNRDQIPPEDGMPIVVMHDSHSKGVFAFVAPRKGECEYATRRASHDIDKIMGYKKFIIKGDQEPALRTLIDSVAALCGDQVEIQQIMQEETPVGESQSNGPIENAVGRVQGQYRTMKSDLETQYKGKIPKSHPVIPWLVRHAAMTMNRYGMGEDGMTAYRRLKGKKFKGEMLKIGECVWFLRPKSKGKDKSDARWEEGIWLGIREESGEHIVGNKNGVVKVRSVRVRGSHEDKWNWVEFQELQGTPWEPTPGRPGVEMRANINLRVEDGMDDDPVQEREIDDEKDEI